MPTEAPSICPDCAAGTLVERTIAEAVVMKHEGVAHSVVAQVPAFVCSRCGASYTDSRADQIFRHALREILGVLQPETLRALREKHHLTQREVAEETKIAQETLSRYENGRLIPSKSNNQLLRFFFDSVVEREKAKRVSRSASVAWSNDNNPEATAFMDSVNSNYALAA